MTRRLVVLAWLALGAGCADETLVDHLDERQSLEVVAALGQAGVPAARVSSTDEYRVTVARSDQARAAAALVVRGLPRRAPAGLAALGKSAGLVPTPAEDQARLLHALGEDLAAHLGRLEGVLEASVLVGRPEPDPFAPADAPRGKTTASVVLRVPDAGPARVTVEDVQRLAAAAVPGLAAADVTVVLVPVPLVAAAPVTWAQVGPIRVAASSRATLVAILALGCVVIAALGLWVVRAERRRAALGRTLAGRERM